MGSVVFAEGKVTSEALPCLQQGRVCVEVGLHALNAVTVEERAVLPVA